jgi:superfamily II DNA or RNA helicase
MSILAHAYLGRQGFTIPKHALSSDELESIRKDLTMTPVIPGAPRSVIPVSFCCYRENAQKIYVPRFYGISRFGGTPCGKPCDLFPGDDIDIPFCATLRDDQQRIVDVYLNHCLEKNGAILEVPCGRGKTVMALYIMSMLRKKTIILVHKEFLMNQWIERIQQFLGAAVRVGKIQGAVYDVDNKDIVIAMIQSIYDDDSRYQTDHFASFGLTIIDETHRIGSAQFCRALWKLPTAFLLGISATVQRKDGLTDILFHFIGPLIYSETGRGEQDQKVNVRAIFYESDDPAFLHVERDFHGTTKTSTMMSKVCECPKRKDFAVRVILDVLAEFPGNQIMILSHQRRLLEQVFEAIQKETTVGYYIGGMKESALKETEEKRVVLATFAMAAEALDIKTLSTLILLTPKVDVIQAVGRILRQHHDHPLIVDLVDPHDCFHKQWLKRRQYYRQCGYDIVSTTLSEYGNGKWKNETKETKETKRKAISASFSFLARKTHVV